MSGLLDPTPLAWQDPFGGPITPATANATATGAPTAAPTEATAVQPPAAAAPQAKVIYPLFIHATQDFHTGARYFRAPRGPGRIHAAVDLIAPHLTKIRAIADGTVIQPPYYFYTGTNALEVDHPGIGVVRYGEIDKHQVVKFKAGDKVKQGDLIAYVGRLDSGSSMLHFELYDGTAKGPLTVRVPPFQRRKDLVNPTKLMEQLQKAAFGQ